MKAAITINHAEHQKTHGSWIKQGLERHGIECAYAAFDHVVGDADMHVCWGWRQNKVKSHCRSNGIPLLVMERGHIQPRMEFTSCGINGLGNRARYPKAQDGGERWERRFSHHLRPWRDNGAYALICGQVAGDASIHGIDFRAWAQRACNVLRQAGYAVWYRPHPLSSRHKDVFCPEGAHFSTRSIEDDLNIARCVIVYNSTAGVEAALAGVPVIAMDEGAMAWPVSSHILDAPLIRPDRTAWCHDLAWTQWSPEDLIDGTAWEALKTCIN